MLSTIKSMNNQSVNDVVHMESIRKFTNYKYPVAPSTDANGEDIYGEILSKVNSRWDEGELEDLKCKSQSKSRLGSSSPTFRLSRFQNRVGSTNVQEFKATGNTSGLNHNDSNTSQSRSPYTVPNKTFDRKGHRQS